MSINGKFAGELIDRRANSETWIKAKMTAHMRIRRRRGDDH
jgi:hypothetical protein